MDGAHGGDDEKEETVGGEDQDVDVEDSTSVVINEDEGLATGSGNYDEKGSGSVNGGGGGGGGGDGRSGGSERIEPERELSPIEDFFPVPPPSASASHEGLVTEPYIHLLLKFKASRSLVPFFFIIPFVDWEFLLFKNLGW